MPVTIKSAREIELMAEAGRILEIVHNELRDALHAGMSTLDIDRLGEEIIRSYDCIPSFLNYNGYPAFHLASNVMSVREMINKKEAHQMPRSISPMVCAIMLMPSENRLSPKGCTNADTIRRVR